MPFALFYTLFLSRTHVKLDFFSGLNASGKLRAKSYRTMQGSRRGRALSGLLKRGVALAFCDVTLLGKKPLPPHYPTEPKTIGEHLLKRRLDLKLTKVQAGKIIGATYDTVILWESDRIQPKLSHMPGVIGFLGYYPYPTDTLGQKVLHYRYMRAMSKKEMGSMLRVSAETVTQWEQGVFNTEADGYQRLLNLLNQ